MPVFYHNFANLIYFGLVFDELNPDGSFRGFTVTGAPLPINHLKGGRGDDTIYGEGTHHNWIVGGDGDDWLIGSAAAINKISGDAGNDSIDGGHCADTLEGGAGSDTIRGYGGDDNIYDMAGWRSVIDAGRGDDYVEEHCAQATVWGGDGDDQIDAYEGDSTIWGGSGNDLIYVRDKGNVPYSHFVNDGDGDDQVRLYCNEVTVAGSQGHDYYNLAHDIINIEFKYSNVNQSSTSSGVDMINDFRGDHGDSIDLGNLPHTVPWHLANSHNLAGEVQYAFNGIYTELWANAGNNNILYVTLFGANIAANNITW